MCRQVVKGNTTMIQPQTEAAVDDDDDEILRALDKFFIEDINKVKEVFENHSKYFTKSLIKVFIIDGINNSESEIENFKRVIKEINPTIVQLNSLDRPAPEEWVKKAESDILENFKEKLGYSRCEIISKYKNRENIKGYSIFNEELIISMIEKRPCTLEDIVSVSNIDRAEVNKYLDILEKEKKIESIIGERGVFIKKL
jgi:wyosine [tRNA(Phe)-imidazoG37] synthetase (radical SAM superfamily)